MKVLLFGSRDWMDNALIRQTLRAEAWPEGTVFIHGGNGYDASGYPLTPRQPDSRAVRGADCLAGAVVAEMGYEVRRFFADWRTHGRAAGPLRNREMAAERPDRAICFHPNVESSRGSRDMLDVLRKLEIPVMVIDGKETGDE
jgi:hypothetical protein